MGSEPLRDEGFVRALESDPSFEIAGECSRGDEMSAALQEGGIDLVFLDLDDEGDARLDTLAELPPERMPLLVFLATDDRYAVQAFRTRTVDYVPKPFTDGRLGEACARAKARVLDELMVSEPDRRRRLVALLERMALEMGVADPDLHGDTAGRFVVRKSKGRFLIVDRRDVRWVEAAREYVRLHTDSGSHLIRETMAGVEEMLGGGGFVRIHRSVIVRLDCVTEIQSDGGGRCTVQLDDGSLHSASRSGWKRLQDRLGLGTRQSAG